MMNKLCTTRLAEPLATFLKKIQEAISVAWSAPLLRDATSLFSKHFKGAKDDKVTFYVHEAVKILRRAFSK